MLPDWVDLNHQQNLNARVDKFMVSSNSRYRIGKNVLVNRLTILNNTIELYWLNQSLETFKIKCKERLLTW